MYLHCKCSDTFLNLIEKAGNTDDPPIARGPITTPSSTCTSLSCIEEPNLARNSQLNMPDHEHSEPDNSLSDKKSKSSQQGPGK